MNDSSHRMQQQINKLKKQVTEGCILTTLKLTGKVLEINGDNIRIHLINDAGLFSEEIWINKLVVDQAITTKL
jgi:hypothetical protein